MDLQWAEHWIMGRIGGGRASKIGGDKIVVLKDD